MNHNKAVSSVLLSGIAAGVCGQQEGIAKVHHEAAGIVKDLITACYFRHILCKKK